MKNDSNCTKPFIADSALTKHRTTLNGVPDYAYNVERPIKNKKDGESYYFASDKISSVLITQLCRCKVYSKYFSVHIL